jgi:uncharacterized Rossmann fold enzyme
MQFDEWEPLYLQILADFGFSRQEDEVASVVLFNLLAQKKLASIKELKEIISGKIVCVVGNAPRKIDKIPDADVYIAADGATAKMLEHGILPAIITTDLDGDMRALLTANRRGSIAIIHAHGDNIPALETYVPKFKGKVLGSTQSTPFTRLINFGGFTDGDRAVCLAVHLDAQEILLLNFDFEDVFAEAPANAKTKLKKLKWAKKIIEMCSKSGTVRFL